jgi:molybdenum cofactor biosynthesis protein B
MPVRPDDRFRCGCIRDIRHGVRRKPGSGAPPSREPGLVGDGDDDRRGQRQEWIVKKPTRPFVPVRFAVLAVSDSRSLDDDRSGATLAGRIEAAGHILADRAIVTDDKRKIAARVRKWLADKDVDVIVTTGGTGFTGRDVTPEAIEPLFEKRMDGFSAVFHRISYDKIGTSTIQSRATAGLAKGKFVFVLPGSPGACKDAWDGILVRQFDYRQEPCNFVEIMPRLDEHLKRTKLKKPAKPL